MPDNHQSIPLRFVVNPLYWPTWIGLGLLYACTRLPYAWMLRLGTALGWLSYYLLPERRRITRINLRLVYPELDKRGIQRLVRESFYSASIAVLESAWAWWASDTKIKPLLHIEGLENLQAAEQLDKGILMLGGHYTTLEISGRLLAYTRDNVFPTYKPAHNELFEWFMTRNRRRMNKGLISSDDMRGIIRTLKRQEIIWYAPDQDFGGDRSVFAPFMGIQTSTLTMSARLARAAGAPVVPFYSERLPGRQGYLLRFGPMLENFPCGDDVRDAGAVNAAIELQVRRTPAQYLWGHRRFKTRPHGEPQLYPLRRGKFLRRYTQALILLSVPALLYTVWLSIRHRQWDYLRERIGIARYPRADLIIHAASIGEVNGIAPLLNLILARVPQLRILFTVNTPSGRATAERRFGDKLQYRYLPIDWRWAAYRFLRQVKPSCLLIMETELWPNLYAYCYVHGLRNIIVNARLSERSFKAPFFVIAWLSHAIQFSYAVLARSQEDARRYISLGGKPDYVKLLGNIKYATVTEQETTAIDLQREYVVLASSRDDEEKAFVQTWQSMDADKPLLVIVPRHIQRLPDILNDLQPLNLQHAVRSRHDAVTDATQIYIADTFGELNGFLAGARFVVMGGSFGRFGGQNIIEVARAGKAVIFGPHMENFQSEAQEFLADGAAIQVQDQDELAAELRKLLDDPALTDTIGNHGKALVQRNAGIVNDYFAELQRLCPLLKPDN